MNSEDTCADVHRLDQWDQAMRYALHRESQEILRHQIEIERYELGRGTKNDAFFAIGLVGFAAGIGYAVGAFRPPEAVRKFPAKVRQTAGMNKKKSKKK